MSKIMRKTNNLIGIDLTFHWSVVILVIVLLEIFTSMLSTKYANLSIITQVVLSILWPILILISGIIHELSHVYIGRMYGIRFSEIVLFAFGGAAKMRSHPASPKAEFMMAIAGPFSSILLSAICFMAFTILLHMHLELLSWYALTISVVNVMFGMFNMIPAFPLDGGRVARSIAWWTTKDFKRATNLVVTIAHIICMLMITYGIFEIIKGNIIGGIWIGIISVLLIMASKAEQRTI